MAYGERKQTRLFPNIPHSTYPLPAARSAACIQQIYGQAERAIRTGKLNALPHLHVQPIDVVVFDGPSEDSR